MARRKKYTQRTLEQAVRRYFASISRERTITERVDSGRKDSSGHVIWNTVPIKNLLGEEMKVIEYMVPPTVGGLCSYLGIHRSTWHEYSNKSKHPELAAITGWAKSQMQAWLEEQLVTRRDVRGVVFDLENNYGYGDRDSDAGSEAVQIIDDL